VVRVNGTLFFATVTAGLAVVLVLVLELDVELVLDFVVDAGAGWASAAPKKNTTMVNIARRIEIRMTMIVVQIRMTKFALAQNPDHAQKPAASGLFRPIIKLTDAHPVPEDNRVGVLLLSRR